MRELRMMAAVSHPAIVQFQDLGWYGARLFFVMPWLQGTTLEDAGQLSRKEVRRIFENIASGVAALHSKGMRHQDIKPSNIFLSRSTQGERVKVLDFGIARVLGGARLTATGAVLGTPEYMSPEQAIGGEVGPASDLYSLGVVLFEALAGRLPFLGSGARLLMQHAFEPAPDLADVAPGVPADLVAVVMRLLEKSPEDRYQSAEGLAWESHWAFTPPTEPATPPAAGDASRRPSRWPLAPLGVSPAGAAPSEKWCGARSMP
jgi:serine/threonine-protein kinase